ncbi:MAG: aldehyde dehydrogenase, partial [Calditrichaeota bacterium]
MDTLLNYINGEFVPPASGEYIDNFNPATGEVYSRVPDSDERDVETAVEAARAAFPQWSVTPAQERSRILMRISERITHNLHRLALAESVDNGKPLWLARTVDIPRAAANFEFFAAGIRHFFSEFHAMEDRALNYTLRNPIGVAGCISPWNLPLYLFTWKVAPAIAAGNCVVAKPSEITPMTAYLLGEICTEAGLPPGVLNIVHGHGPKVGAAITRHPDIPCISFTGGTQTGAEIARTAGPMFKKLSLELGGKNPNIVFADCRYEEMLETSLRAAFSNQGEICLCGSRIFVERPLYERFRDDFVARARELTVGDPLDKETAVGAVVSQAHMEKILSYIRLAQEEGGVVLCGGDRVILPGRCRNGWFVQPTVIEGLAPTCRTNQEEIFGPVATLIPFDTEEEVLEYANGVEYGLAAILWTENLTRAHRIANRLQAGIIWINCWMLRDLRTPFGGMKHSGVG